MEARYVNLFIGDAPFLHREFARAILGGLAALQ